MFHTKSLIQMAMMATLLVVLGFIPALPLGFIPVPIVLQNLGVMMAGVILGGRKGSLSILLFFLVGLVIPVFSGLRSTIPVLTGPTAGYVIAWFFVPLLISYGVKLINKKNFIAIFLIVWLAGVLFVDVAGAIWLASYTNIPLDKSLLQNLVFIPGDTIKAIIAAVVAVKYKDSFFLTEK
ncbi:TPA: biotin transporter BioY [Streptococcus agalactiae]|uniref:biotin transporter BioY n=1 Tax=Streptococcus agalactiae TaxID=1311 RepID=UPI0002BAFD77|nr:biotin transporter BioY [Streptococcus agalactiae]EPU32001.1 biotin biosynthesis protein BioC [Streptococcus agalactiae MRI Z1-039]EPV05152.1 biotin biosynthesis protein BioC [Streptococcus agalactiae GB00300]KLK51599.1 biotin biosynthesis protein BioY [Streptococcus agalactiae]MCC9788384.1 biotin transporter BioY [Streptococcus agalactiae]MCD0119125.1 biotin transporter BioY [Streptococcus agalactiae]